MDFKTFNLYDNSDFVLSHFPIASGVVLPSGRVAMVWIGDDRTFNIYPDIEALKTIQGKQPNREIIFGGFSPNGYHLTTFKLVRQEDVTGVSGEGIVAYGCYFHAGAVLEWCGEVASIAYYPEGVAQIQKLHGHDGKTVIEEDITPSW